MKKVLRLLAAMTLGVVLFGCEREPAPKEDGFFTRPSTMKSEPDKRY